MTNMEFDRRVVISTRQQSWQASPHKGVWRKPLAREEAERGHATSIVRYDAGASFAAHGHPLGEEILVLEGTFSDDSGDFPAGSYIIATEPLSDELVNEINPMDLAVCDPNYVLDYYRLSADKRMLFGGRCNYSGRDPQSIQETMLPRMIKIYPQLENVKIDFEWGGKIGLVINRIPHIGRIDKNIFYAQGYSGHGLNVTHLAGQILADAISGTYERFDIFEKVKHFQIPGSQWIGNQLVALGMIYFRLMDLR